jgi:uncharacterized membrane protein YkgB
MQNFSYQLPGYILIRFKPLTVEYNGSMLLIAIAQRTLLMLITTPQLPLPVAGSADGVRFKIIDGHGRLC